MSRKSARLAKLQAATDRQAGERVLIKPQQGGGYLVGGADTNRDEFEFTGYVTRVPASIRSSTSGPNTGSNVVIRASADTVKYTTSTIPYTVAEGDLIQLLEADDQPMFRVSRTAPLGTDRTILFLTRASR